LDRSMAVRQDHSHALEAARENFRFGDGGHTSTRPRGIPRGPVGQHLVTLLRRNTYSSPMRATPRVTLERQNTVHRGLSTPPPHPQRPLPLPSRRVSQPMCPESGVTHLRDPALPFEE
jgi:hypothetical protein